LHRQGKDKEAVQVLAPLYEKDRSLKGLALTYADALTGVGELAKAEQVLRAALIEPAKDISATATSPNANSANANTTTAVSTNATSPNAGSANANSPNAVSTNASTETDNSAQVALHFKLGVLLNRQDRFDEAAAELKKAVTINDTAANAHLLLGATLLQLNRLDDAEKSLLRAYEVAGPGAGTAQMFLGQLYLMQQKPAAALKAFEQYLKDVPAATNTVQIKAEIEKLRAVTKN
jgi:tetratricopeptide (TPR) repeat protein